MPVIIFKTGKAASRIIILAISFQAEVSDLFIMNTFTHT